MRHHVISQPRRASTHQAMNTRTLFSTTVALATLSAISRHEQSVLPTQALLDGIRMEGQRAVAMTLASP
jgi:hypothetical protein